MQVINTEVISLSQKPTKEQSHATAYVGLTKEGRTAKLSPSKPKMFDKADQPNCGFCMNRFQHPINECCTVTKLTDEDILTVARKSKLCFLCLNGGAHRLSECKAAKCSKCQGRHHTLLHDDKTLPTVNALTLLEEDDNTAGTWHVVAPRCMESWKRRGNEIHGLAK